MPATPFDSAIYRGLFGDDEVAKLFSDTAEVRAMMLVEGALAKAQGSPGIIPEISAQAIHRAAMEAQVDPATLSEATGKNGVPVPGFVTAFRAAMEAPEHAQYLHWGATSQDIIDTALALRLRQALTLFDARMAEILGHLARLAADNAETPMLGRTYGQAAVPTSFGAVVAAWGFPLIRNRRRLAELRPDIEVVSLFGAAGTASALERRAEVRGAMAEALGLAVAEDSRHSARDAQGALASWLAGLCGSLGKMGADLVALTATEVGEVRLGDSGGSSTMPQKANPVGPSKLVALANLTAAISTAMQGAAVHLHQRDGGAMFTEWLVLPQMVAATGSALLTARHVLQDLIPDTAAMSGNIDATHGMVFAEALSFALANTMSRPDAQAAVKDLVKSAHAQGIGLEEAARGAYPTLEHGRIFAVSEALGDAPDQARAFARAVANDG